MAKFLKFLALMVVAAVVGQAVFRNPGLGCIAAACLFCK